MAQLLAFSKAISYKFEQKLKKLQKHIPVKIRRRVRVGSEAGQGMPLGSYLGGSYQHKKRCVCVYIPLLPHI